MSYLVFGPPAVKSKESEDGMVVAPTDAPVHPINTLSEDIATILSAFVFTVFGACAGEKALAFFFSMVVNAFNDATTGGNPMRRLFGPFSRMIVVDYDGSIAEKQTIAAYLANFGNYYCESLFPHSFGPAFDSVEEIATRDESGDYDSPEKGELWKLNVPVLRLFVVTELIVRFGERATKTSKGDVGSGWISIAVKGYTSRSRMIFGTSTEMYQDVVFLESSKSNLKIVNGILNQFGVELVEESNTIVYTVNNGEAVVAATSKGKNSVTHSLSISEGKYFNGNKFLCLVQKAETFFVKGSRTEYNWK